ncbi:cellulase family glycosylhydrolase [Paenibacillus sp. SYP-B4298]|uniref:cellulase family glycosylhydrolase n=1 Tax=Paenibacillus sp. SYP-B4298 TaxID=2996034 RepID=UPI0022DDE2FF|nr:cellulase family glycosylhydrolase [Paenibacillus sp. SYP-B4298]
MKRQGKGLMLLMTLLLLSLLASGLASAAPQAGSSPVQALSTSPMQNYVDAMQPGWNLGNSFDSVGLGGTSNPSGEDETAWGNPIVTQQQIQQIANQGYKSIRIPITWEHKLGTAPSYTIQPAYLNRIEQVVNWSLNEGLYVMINIHHDSWSWVNNMGNQRTQVLNQFNKIWEQVADRFKNHSNKLMFESINEPQFSSWGWYGQQEMLDTLNSSFHSIVRASGGENATRPLVLPTMHTSSEQQHLDALYNSMISLNDPNLIATVHYYGFWPFSVNIAGVTRFDEQTRADIISSFDRVHNTFTARGIPVVVGEFGLLGFDQHTGTIEQGEKLKFFEYMIYYAQLKKLTHMLWDNGQHFNRLTFQWKDQQLFDMMKASWTSRSATASTDLIFIKQGQSAADTPVTLALNEPGNQFLGLSVNGANLNPGTDYTLNSGVLTFKAGLLNNLTAGKPLGHKTVIKASFSKGASWLFNVIVYNTPSLSAASGQTSSFAIPTSFNGDQLATMEAVYPNGSNAGPQNWTSFKEFAYTFEPSYGSNQIVLKQNFFNDVNNGTVILKFHFWSGAVIQYTLNKSGNWVSGTP